MKTVQGYLSQRYLFTLKEYQEKLYLHLRDSHPAKKAKQISLHAEAVLDLAQKIPKIVDLIRKFEESKPQGELSSDSDAEVASLESLDLATFNQKPMVKKARKN